MHAPGLSQSSPNRALIRRPWMPPEPSYLVGGYGEIENEIDNLDNLILPINPFEMLFWHLYTNEMSVLEK